MSLTYLGAKLVVYSAWCYLGMRLFRSPALFSESYVSPFNSSVTAEIATAPTMTIVLRALALGFVRFAMGWLIAVMVFVIGGAVSRSSGSAFDKQLALYVVFLIPARSLEWWVTANVIGKTSASSPVFWWVFGGVLLSCLGDIPANFGIIDVVGFC